MTASSRTLQHVGEWKVEIRAGSVEDVFVELARVIARETGWGGDAQGDPGRWEPIAIESRDLSGLLVDWANELIGRSEIVARAYPDVRSVRLDADHERYRVSAEVRGHFVAEFGSVLKAATYHDAVLDCHDGECRAEVLFDV